MFKIDRTPFIRIASLLCLGAAMFGAIASAAPVSGNPVVTGKVVGFPDADTIRVRSDNGSYEVRLYAIDAPGRGEALYRESRNALRDTLADQPVSIEIIEVDEETNTLAGVVRIGDREINLEMLQNGYAWVDRRKTNVDAAYMTAESEAQKSMMGIWSLPEGQTKIRALASARVTP